MKVYVKKNIIVYNNGSMSCAYSHETKGLIHAAPIDCETLIKSFPALGKVHEYTEIDAPTGASWDDIFNMYNVINTANV